MTKFNLLLSVYALAILGTTQVQAEPKFTHQIPVQIDLPDRKEREVAKICTAEDSFPFHKAGPRAELLKEVAKELQGRTYFPAYQSDQKTADSMAGELALKYRLSYVEYQEVLKLWDYLYKRKAVVTLTPEEFIANKRVVFERDFAESIRNRKFKSANARLTAMQSERGQLQGAIVNKGSLSHEDLAKVTDLTEKILRAELEIANYQKEARKEAEAEKRQKPPVRMPTPHI